jgi:hypothetical protein
MAPTAGERLATGWRAPFGRREQSRPRNTSVLEICCSNSNSRSRCTEASAGARGGPAIARSAAEARDEWGRRARSGLGDFRMRSAGGAAWRGGCGVSADPDAVARARCAAGDRRGDGRCVSQAQVGRRVELDRATVSYLMARLALRGLVDRAPAHDAPEWRIYLTEQGKQLLERGRALIESTSARLPG